ncbi:SLC13 family permease [Desulfonauticus submarinus]
MKFCVKTFLKRIIKEWLLLFSLLGLFITSLYLKHFPYYSIQDFKIIYILGVLLVIIKGLERANLFNVLSSYLNNTSYLPLKIIIVTIILAMFITNDVALMIVVPLTLCLDIDRKEYLIILEALASNAGSSLTPFGNPQNLFLYWFYNLNPNQFFKVTASFIWLNILIVFLSLMLFFQKKYLNENNNMNNNSVNLGKLSNIKGYIYLIFLLIFILCIMKMLPIYLGIIIILYVISFDIKSLFIDYYLLLTFLIFFGFTDNLMNILYFKFDTGEQVFWVSLLLSQFISNVPSTLLVADFTNKWDYLLWGVNIGGFGTLISSLANIIAYRLYVNNIYISHNNRKSFLIKFHLLSFFMLMVGCILFKLLN